MPLVRVVPQDLSSREGVERLEAAKLTKRERERTIMSHFVAPRRIQLVNGLSYASHLLNALSYGQIYRSFSYQTLQLCEVSRTTFESSDICGLNAYTSCIAFEQLWIHVLNAEDCIK